MSTEATIIGMAVIAISVILAATGIHWEQARTPAVNTEEMTRTCGTCTHYDANSAATENVGYCTNPNGWHRAKQMPPNECCSKWEASHE